MLTQAIDFRDESEALYNLVKDLSDADYQQKTAFNGWTLNDVFEHLHMWNWAANESLVNEKNFLTFLDEVMGGVAQGKSLKDYERVWIKGLAGRALLETWRAFYLDMAARFENTAPKLRLKWAGPDMSARSSITARLMETWAHGQEVYDQLGTVRKNHDRIKNIAILGVNTYGWTYACRGETPLGDMPYLCLSAPSGEVWEFGDPTQNDRIEGVAEEFCQVVTQTRNIADTRLSVTGAVANDWMAKAQCFAGAPANPPAPGTRKTLVK